MEILQTLLVVYIVILAINAAISAQMWLIHKSRPFLLLVGVWLFTLINFFLQGALIDNKFASILAFSTYLPAALCLTGILSAITDIPFKFRPYWIAFGVSLVATAVLYVFTTNFTLLALPVAVAIAAPQIKYSLLKLMKYRARGPELSNVFTVVLLLNGAHFLDYPFLRPYPESAIYGFGAVLVFTCIFSALLPAIIGKHHSDQLSTRLRESLKETEKLARVKTDFLAHMSHEIRSPITGIMGLNEILLSTDLTPEQRKYCETMNTATNNLLFIINNVLSLAQLESGHTTLRNMMFSPTAMAEEIIEHYQFQSDASDIVLQKELANLPQALEGDKGKILQIAYNLINNAIKYSKSDVIKLILEYRAIDAASGTLLLTVQDYGRGIPKDQQDLIYAQFKQISSDQGGVGLGLTIVKELLALLQGTIQLTSEINKGTAFQCAIPIKTGSAGVADHERADAGSKFEKKRPSNGQAVLLVEDNVTTQMVMQKIFDQERVALVIVGTAEEALKELSRRFFRLVITDIDLPNMDGLEMIRFIRKINPTIYIIVYSAYAYEEDVASAMVAGANDYIRKPAHNDEIISKYRNAMAKLQ